MNNKNQDQNKVNKGLVYAVWSGAIIVSVIAVIFAVIFASCAKGDNGPLPTEQARTIVYEECL